MRLLDLFWMTNPEWYKFQNGIAVPTDKAPAEALKSYSNYLAQQEAEANKRKTVVS